MRKKLSFEQFSDKSTIFWSPEGIYINNNYYFCKFETQCIKLQIKTAALGIVNPSPLNFEGNCQKNEKFNNNIYNLILCTGPKHVESCVLPMQART